MAERADSLNLTPEQLTQHPEAALLLSLLGGLMIAIVLGFFVTTIIAAVRLALGKPLLPVQPWTPRVWGLIDLILIVVLIILAQLLTAGIWSQLAHSSVKQLRKEGDFPISAMAAFSASYLVTMVLSIGWLLLRYGVSLAHIGFTFARLRSNLVLGVGTTLLSLPVVYFVMWLVSTEFNQEYDHPLLTSMAKDGTVTAFLLAMFSAVIAAPIWEEFLFRVMLQGWLQSIPFSRRHFWWFIGASEEARQKIEVVETLVLRENAFEDASVDADRLLAAESQNNPYAPPTPPAAVALTDGVSDRVMADPSGLPVMSAPPIWPVFVSGTLFGLAHLDYGLSFVPLILLGIILGFLYRATHSIWPGLAVHFILNFIAIISLGIITYIKTIVQ